MEETDFESKCREYNERQEITPSRPVKKYLNIPLGSPSTIEEYEAEVLAE